MFYHPSPPLPSGPIMVEDFSAGVFAGEKPASWTLNSANLAGNWSSGHSNVFDPQQDGTGGWQFAGSYDGNSESFENYGKAFDLTGINEIWFDMQSAGINYLTTTQSTPITKFQVSVSGGTALTEGNLGYLSTGLRYFYGASPELPGTADFLDCKIDVSALTGSHNLIIEARQRHCAGTFRLANIRFYR